jgi:hypothetical protein
MGIWVVVMEAVAGEDPTTIDLDDLDALGDALAPNYPQLTGGPSWYQAQVWVEEATAGAALMLAQRLWQSAVREVGLPPWDVVRAEARDAHAIEAGLIEWSPEVDEPDFGPALDEEELVAEEGPFEDEEEEEEEEEGEEPGEALLEEEELEEALLDEEELEEEPGVLALGAEEAQEAEDEEVLAAGAPPFEPAAEEEEEEEEEEEPEEVAAAGFDLGDELEDEGAAPLRPHLRAAAEKRAAARRAAREQPRPKRAAAEPALKKLAAKKLGAKKAPAKKAAGKKAAAKKLGAKATGSRRPLRRR